MNPSTNVQKVVSTLGERTTLIAGSLEVAHEVVTKLQLVGRPEDEKLLKDLRDALDNISVNNNFDGEVNSLNDAANSMTPQSGVDIPAATTVHLGKSEPKISDHPF